MPQRKESVMATAISLATLRSFAIRRSLFPATSLPRALDKLAFVQADPIRAPARAQDLTLRHRVTRYSAGDLERLYPTLDVEEDFFINYGYVTRRLHALMHPRVGVVAWGQGRGRHGRTLLEFVRERGLAHPREVDAHFARGTVTNYWGGSSNATTHLLGDLHYRGELRVAGRDAGIRIYAPRDRAEAPVDAAARRARVDEVVDAAVGLYAPLPTASLSDVVRRLRYAVPQWRGELNAALVRARARLSRETVGDVDWYWPAGERVPSSPAPEMVRLLAPFDPVVWDRRRFELLWGWAYRFEAYTPVPKRKLGYYALPLLWRDRVIGWANVSVADGELRADTGFVSGAAPRERAFRRELEAELERLRRFLRLSARPSSPVSARGAYRAQSDRAPASSPSAANSRRRPRQPESGR